MWKSFCDQVQIICLNLRSKRTNLFNFIGLGLGLFSLKADEHFCCTFL